MTNSIKLNRGVTSRAARLVRWGLVALMAGIALVFVVSVVSGATQEPEGPDYEKACEEASLADTYERWYLTNCGPRR